MKRKLISYGTLYVSFVLSGAITLWAVEGIPLWKGLCLAGMGNLTKTLIVVVHGLFFGKAAPPADLAQPAVEPPHVPDVGELFAPAN